MIKKIKYTIKTFKDHKTAVEKSPGGNRQRFIVRDANGGLIQSEVNPDNFVDFLSAEFKSSIIRHTMNLEENQAVLVTMYFTTGIEHDLECKGCSRCE